MNRPGFWASPSEYRELAAAITPTPGEEIATRKMAEWVSSARTLPNPDEVLRKMGKSTVAVYRTLLTDPRVWAAVQHRKTGIKSMDWEIHTGKAVAAHVTFIEEVFEKLDIPRITGQFLNAPLFGLQPMERRWAYREDGRLIVTDLAGKPVEWFLYNNEGQLRFLKKGTAPDGVEVDPFTFQIARHEDEYGNPYGFPILSTVFWSVAFKKGFKKFRAIFTEKWGGAHAFALIPPGTDKAKVQEYLKQLQSLVQDGVAAIYDNAKVNIVEAAGKAASGELYQSGIDDENADIATAILGHQGATTSTPGKLGGEDMAFKSREDVVWADKNLVVNQYNILIRDLIRFNFGDKAEPPVFAFYEKEEVDRTLVERDAMLAEKLGLEFTPEYFQEKHGLNPEHFKLKAKVPEPTPAPAPGPVPPKVELAAPPVPAPPPLEDEALVELNANALEALAKAAGEDVLQAMAEETLAPVLLAVKEAKGYDELRAELAALFDKMETVTFEETLGRLLFLSEALGRES